MGLFTYAIRRNPPHTRFAKSCAGSPVLVPTNDPSVSLLPFGRALYSWVPLYGNSRRKAEHITLVNFLKAVLMEYMARHADAACVESPSVAHHWKIDYEREGLHTVHLYVEDAFFNAGLSY